MQKRSIIIPLFIAILFISGCSGVFPGVYRIDIPQGNLITEEKVEQVKIGMNRRQVRFVLGSPLLVDPFNQDRWDYFYSVSNEKGTTVEHHVTIVFKQDVVSDIKGDRPKPLKKS